MLYDAIVIGGGVVGCAVTDKLAFSGYKTLLLEKDDDVATGASRANSGVIHAGYDCVPGTLKAKFNAAGVPLIYKLADELDVPVLNCGSLVVSDIHGLDGLKLLQAKGDEIGVRTEIISRDRILEIEPNVADTIEYALYAPCAGVISPYKLTIALADRAVLNGAHIVTEADVNSLDYKDGLWTVRTADGKAFQAKYVVNSAGAGAARINDLAGAEHYTLTFARGEYFVLDQTERHNINTVIFPLPDESGKGILVAPTADGNVIYGPTSISCEEGDTAADSIGLAAIRAGVNKTYKAANYRKVIRLYAGVRTVCGHDFIVEKSKLANNFFALIGICSPGLTSAPAIAEYIAEELGKLYAVSPKNEVLTIRHRRLNRLSDEQLNELVKQDSRWGRIICRCEKVTEAEIVDAIHSPLPATTVDAVKRRVRAGMGRCQGGFCAPRVMEILSRELSIPLTQVKKGGKDSYIATGKVKED